MDAKSMFDSLKVGMVACDAGYKVTYINKRGEELFKILLNAENLIGKDMRECHKPETNAKLECLFKAYGEQKLKLDYYTMDTPDGKLTIVNVPYYDGDKFAGVVEFIFESALG